MTWPAVFDGIGALVVSSALDPKALLDKLDPATTWIAPKLTGTDTGGDAEVRHCIDVWRAQGLKVGGWVYNTGPPDDDVASVSPWMPLDFLIYDIEAPYKSDEGGHYERAAELVARSGVVFGKLPTAVTSYGGYKTSIDFAAFASAGWPIFAQGYDAFTCADRLSYLAVYPPDGIHCLSRSLALEPGEAVYRPESIDG